jgi:hypothetical protein
MQFKGAADSRRILAIEDDIVLEGVVYQSAKETSSHEGKTLPMHNSLIRSRDNGITWEKVSDITTFEENTNECGIEFLGGQDDHRACRRPDLQAQHPEGQP